MTPPRWRSRRAAPCSACHRAQSGPRQGRSALRHPGRGYAWLFLCRHAPRPAAHRGRRSVWGRRPVARRPRAGRSRRRRARPRGPARRPPATTSASTVGLPLESKISRACTLLMAVATLTARYPCFPVRSASLGAYTTMTMPRLPAITAWLGRWVLRETGGAAQRCRGQREGSSVARRRTTPRVRCMPPAWTSTCWWTRQSRRLARRHWT